MFVESIISTCDVLLGKHPRFRKNPGNIFFQEAVKDAFRSYDRASKSASSNRDHNAIEDVQSDIVNQIHSKGGRFLTQNPSSGEWGEVAIDVALQKVRAEFSRHQSSSSHDLGQSVIPVKAATATEVETAPAKHINQAVRDGKNETLNLTARMQEMSMTQNNLSAHQPGAPRPGERPLTAIAASTSARKTAGSASNTQRKQNQEESSGAPLLQHEECKEVVEPFTTDYLCGKKSFCTSHPGTRFVKDDCVSCRVKDYADAEKGKKEAINAEIVLQVYARQGRFLIQTHGVWSICSFANARRKVGTLFRTKRAQAQKIHKKEPKTPSLTSNPQEVLQPNDVPVSEVWYQNHPGLCYLRDLAAERVEQYAGTRNQKCRERMVAEILEMISGKGGRFKCNKSGRWEIVPGRIAKAKVTKEMDEICRKTESGFWGSRAQTSEDCSSTHSPASCNTIRISESDVYETQSIHRLVEETENFRASRINSGSASPQTKRQRPGSSVCSSKPASKLIRSASNLPFSRSKVSPLPAVYNKDAVDEECVSDLSSHSSSVVSWTCSWPCRRSSRILAGVPGSSEASKQCSGSETSWLQVSFSEPVGDVVPRWKVSTKPTQVVCRATTFDDNESWTEATDGPRNVFELLDRMKNGLDDVALLTGSFGELSQVLWEGCTLSPDVAAAGVQIIVKAITRHSSHPQLVGYGCSALAWLVSASDSSRGCVLPDLDTTLVVVSAMRAHNSIDLVQESGCKALVALSRGGCDNIQVIAKAEGINTVIAAMNGHIQHEQIQEYGCMMLAVLGKGTPTARSPIVGAGGLEAVANALRNYPQRGCIQRNGCFAFRWLVCDNCACKDRIRALGCLELVMGAMQSFPKDAALQAHGNTFLGLVSTSNAVWESRVLSDDNVYVGHAPDVVDSSGNRELQKMVEDELPTYQAHRANGKVSEKFPMITRIMDKIHAGGDRFLKFSSGRGWVEASRKEARAKVSHQFKSQDNASTPRSSEDAAPTSEPPSSSDSSSAPDLRCGESSSATGPNSRTPETDDFSFIGLHLRSASTASITNLSFEIGSINGSDGTIGDAFGIDQKLGQSGEGSMPRDEFDAMYLREAKQGFVRTLDAEGPSHHSSSSLT